MRASPLPNPANFGETRQNEMERETGIEPATSSLGNCYTDSILLVRLALSCALYHGFARYSAVIVPKLLPSFG